MKINWVQKIASRKFWALVGAVVLAVGGLLNINDMTMQQVSVLISAIGACVCYMFAEGGVDKAREQAAELVEIESVTEVE